MSKLVPSWVLLAALLSLSASPLKADGYKEWLNFCGGSTFQTCHSVTLTVTGTSVVLKVKNLSGWDYLPTSYAGSLFSQILLTGVPGGITSSLSSNTSGPIYSGGSTPTTFRTQSTTSGTLKLVSYPDSKNPRNNTLASNCIDTAVIPNRTNLWMTPTCGWTNVNNANDGWVQIGFNVSSTWDPNAAGTELVVKAIDAQNTSAYTECITGPGGNCTGNIVTPEPMTVLLLGSGLVGMGGAAMRRRRLAAAG